MAAKLNLQQIGTAYLGASVASVATGIVGGYILTKLGYDVDFGLAVSATWLTTTGVPSLVVAGETLRRTLGQKQPATVTAAGGGLGRKIPFTAGGRTSHIFASVIPNWAGAVGDPAPGWAADVGLAQQFTVTLDQNDYTLPLPDVADFLYTAWRRQRAGLNGLSRQWWTRERRPRIKTLEYSVRMSVLLAIPGLVIDRSERRSGRLALPPKASIAAVQAHF